MKKNRTTLVAALVMGLACPAIAQAPQFHVAVSGQFGNFTGLTEGLALQGRTSAGPSGYGAAPSTYDMKSKTPLQLDLGMLNGDDDFSLSYWAGKAKGDGTFTAPDAQVYYSPYGDYLDNIGMSKGNSEVKAHTLDLAWTRAFAKGDSGSLAFSLGIREFKIERHMFLDQWTTGAPMPHMGYDRIDAESRGVGLSVGLSGRYNFTERVWLTGGMKVAMVDSKNDFRYEESYDPAYRADRIPLLLVQLDGQKQTSIQYDADLKVHCNFVAGFDGFVGYRMKSFQDVLGNDASATYGYNTVYSVSPRTVGFNGAIAGVAYRF